MSHNQTSTTFDFIVIGGGSAGAVLASRLSEDANCTVCLLESGGPPPPAASMPAACSALQNDPAVDWMYEGNPSDQGGVGLGLVGNQVPVPRGKMLGGSSSINYMAYSRGHPGDFDSWAETLKAKGEDKPGADGWSFERVLPLFKKSEGIVETNDEDCPIDDEAHSTSGPMGVSLRQPVLNSARQFVQAANKAGIPTGDYNGRDRGGPEGIVSLWQTTTKDGKRSSTYHAFLEGNEGRRNLTILSNATAQRVILEKQPLLRAVGVEYRDADGALHTVTAGKEVLLSAGAVGSPQLLMLSGIGSSKELEAVGIEPVLDLPAVGKHLKDHVFTPLIFEADGVGETFNDVAISLGPDALRAPAGPLPANPAEDDGLSEDLKGLKAEAERRLIEWATTGHGIPSSSLYDATAFVSSGLGDAHTHDIQICILCCGYTQDLWKSIFRIDADTFFGDSNALDANKAYITIAADPQQPHSEGTVTLASADPNDKPVINFNYYGDSHDVSVAVAAMRKALDIAASWPGDGLGTWLVPPFLAKKHGYDPSSGPAEALLEDIARHYTLTTYHLVSTCRMGDVVDSSLKVKGVAGLRVADASIMPNITSGNTNAPAIMIGEKAAELVASEHDLTINEMVSI